MRIGVPAETTAGETRVAVTPETAKKIIAQGHQVLIQSGAGVAASVTDAAFEAVGAQITDAAGALGAELVLKVRSPSASELGHMTSGSALVGMLNPFDAEGLQRIAAAGLTSFALEAAPRTTRAQSMDVLSSQANIAGYKAVMMAADKYQRFFPMLMTAAGTVKAARVVILGVGVAGLQAIASAGLTSFALEAAPRTTRAQSMDVLSSQANIAGYKAVMMAADKYQRFFPMLMTAAGTVKAARVVILGVGVAGLQAIATAKRLGAVIEASDVRPSVKEQVESLGAKFIDVPYETAEEKEAAEGVGGYARPMPASWLDRQKVEVAKRVAQADAVISTALIPGRAAPVLITEDMVKSMKPGSVIIDLAAGKGANGVGGNCPLTETDRTVVKHGVTLVGETNLPALVAADASALYARNVLDFLKLVLPKDKGFTVDMEDDIVSACLMTQGGDVKRK